MMPASLDRPRGSILADCHGEQHVDAAMWCNASLNGQSVRSAGTALVRLSEGASVLQITEDVRELGEQPSHHVFNP
jgi:hypothetical protein